MRASPLSDFRSSSKQPDPLKSYFPTFWDRAQRITHVNIWYMSRFGVPSWMYIDYGLKLGNYLARYVSVFHPTGHELQRARVEGKRQMENTIQTVGKNSGRTQPISEFSGDDDIERLCWYKG